MATKRDLKKNVNYIVSELFTECLLCSRRLPETEKAKGDELMSDVLKLQDEFISRLNHVEPGNVKNFYKKFLTDFNAKVDAIIDSIGKLQQG